MKKTKQSLNTQKDIKSNILSFKEPDFKKRKTANRKEESALMDIDEMHIGSYHEHNDIDFDDSSNENSYYTDNSNEEDSVLLGSEDNNLSENSNEIELEFQKNKKKVKKAKEQEMKKKERREYQEQVDIVEDIFEEEVFNNIILDLPCRASEQSSIENYIKKGLDTNGCYSSLYLSGMPGTGKTASVLASIKKLTQLSKRKQLKEFDCLLINGMKVLNNNSVYKQIYSHIFKETKINPLKCCKVNLI